MNIFSLKMLKLKILKIFPIKKNILKGGELTMDENALKELNAIEKLLKSYEILNQSLETRVRILEFNLKKVKEELANFKGKDEETLSKEGVIKND
ncbi:MAG: hypothetical protein ACP5KX_07375 [Caldisericia bacterium]